MDLRNELQRTLGQAYVLERELGGGGMSQVFVAEETALQRKVVVKVLPPALTGGVNIERFKREIQLAARLQHAHIVPVLAAGETNGLPFYTMPFVEGESLRARLARGPLSLTETISILRDVARALAYAHDHGIAHRDIKPDNVMLSGGSAVVTDFGIAKAITDSRTDGTSASLTQIGTSLGTPAYMAPEQAAGDPASDHRVDLYAFGCTAYEMLAGEPPFTGMTPQQLMAAQMSKTPEPIQSRRADVPSTLAEMIMRCLEKEAAARPGSAGEIARALENVTSGGGHATMPPILLAHPGMLRRALATYAGAFVVVAIVAKAAIVGIGLPDWVFPGALIVMALGLPVILFTWYVQRVARATMLATPTYTPGGSATLRTDGTLATMAMRASPHVTWKRTAVGGALALAGFAIVVGGFMTLRAMGVGPAGSLLSSGKLSASDQILVADFRTTGADSMLSGVLAEALRASLTKSRRVRIVQASAVAAGLQRMGRPPSTPLDLPLAHELAQRDGFKAIAAGELTPVSGGYLVTVKLLAAATGDVLTSFQESADGAATLIPTMDQLGRNLRGKIGESLRDVQATPALARVTTPSLEALRKFTEGARANDFEGNPAKAVPLLQEAIALDSNFAMAIRKLAISLGDIGRWQEAHQVIERGYRIRDRIPEAERLALLGVYYQRGPSPDRDKSIRAYEELFAKYPEWLVIITSDLMADQLETRREFARAESLRIESIRLAPDEITPYADVIRLQVYLGAYERAMASVARARAHDPQPPQVDLYEPIVHYSAGHIDSAKAIYTRLAAGNDDRGRTAQRQLGLLAVREGRLADAERRFVAAGANANAAHDNPDGFLIAQRWLRRPDEARRRLAAFIDRALLNWPPDGERTLFEARWRAMLGDSSRARAHLAQFEAMKIDSLERRRLTFLHHDAKAWVALTTGQASDAVREFRQSDSLPDGPIGACPICRDIPLALAFERANMPDSAIAMYEHFVNTPTWGRIAIDAANLPWALYRLGRLYEAIGNASQAGVYYRQFVDLWKNADPELQVHVKDAREQIRRLADIERR